jgi:transcriptional regulator with XRE-family HTH domain
MISRYERDEMKPSIEVALKLAKELETSISYLAGEVRHPRDKESESILDDLNSIPESDRNKIKTTIHSLLKLSRSGQFSN